MPPSDDDLARRRARRAAARARVVRQRRLVAVGAGALVLGLLAITAVVVRGGGDPAPPAETALPDPPPLPPVTEPQWVDRVLVTRYYPVPETWFDGELVATPGLATRHAVDWLYSAQGVMMQGDGIDRDGRRVHVADTGGVAWVDADGVRTDPVAAGAWSAGRPYWVTTGGRNAAGAVTYRKADGSWSNGAAVRDEPVPAGVRFATGPSRPLRFWRSVAVDTRSIPLGSRIFIAALCDTPAKGWATAADTGGAIEGRHLDLYVPASDEPFGDVETLREQRVYVVPEGDDAPPSAPSCARPEGAATTTATGAEATTG